MFIVELPAPLPSAPMELTRFGGWLGHVPTMELDGRTPTSRELHARIASFWLAAQTVLYIGAAETSIAARVAAIDATVLGDRRPHSGGHWLKTLTALATCRVWWASTKAPIEYEDALLTAFAEGLTDAERASLPDRVVMLPFANLRRPTGERRTTGLTKSLLVEAKAAAAPAHTVVVVPDGDADGANGELPPSKRPAMATRSTAGAAPRPARAAATRSPTAGAARTTGGTGGTGAASAQVASRQGAPDPSILTAEGIARLQGELDGLIRDQRPGVIARIRSAKELGDLKENADYTSAREEQSFLEGRIQAIERRLRTAVVADVPSGDRVDLGSTITIIVDGEDPPIRYTLVGSAEADLGNGRLSVASPVGRALMGAREGQEVMVATPRGSAHYRVLTIE